MGFADIFCDPAWVSQRSGLLGPKRYTLRGARSVSLGIAIEFHFFGDEDRVRHVRVVMHTDEQQVAETCLNLNIQTWVAAIEVSVMVETKFPFRVLHMPGSQTFAIGLGQGPEDAPSLCINLPPVEPKTNYERLARGMAAWSGELSHYLFYLRRLVDSNLPLDVRWLNGYRLLEWHFVREAANLNRSPEWRAFVARFDADLEQFLRPRQGSVGLLEEARALAAHAGLDPRSDSERARDPRNAMEKTFRVLERMVATVLNEHPQLDAAIKFIGPTENQP